MADQREKKRRKIQRERRQQLIRRCLIFVGASLAALLLFFGIRAILFRRGNAVQSASEENTEASTETDTEEGQSEETEGDTAGRRTMPENVAGQVGWNFSDAGWWYQDSADTQVAGGWKTIEGRRYYFLEDGRMATGWRQADGTDTYFSVAGQADLSRAQKRVALTFEDGPSEITEEILNLLIAADEKATFFLVGQNRAENMPELLQRMAATGMEIGNHTYDHRTLSLSSYEEVVATIEQNDQLLENITGTRPVLLRPTGALVSDTMNAAVTKPMIFCDIDADDWETTDVGEALENIMEVVRDGSVIRLHDLPAATDDHTVELVRALIPRLQAEGYALETVSKLAESCGYHLQAKEQYTSFYPEEAPRPEEVAADETTPEATEESTTEEG